MNFWLTFLTRGENLTKNYICPSASRTFDVLVSICSDADIRGVGGAVTSAVCIFIVGWALPFYCSFGCNCTGSVTRVVGGRVSSPTVTGYG